MHLGKPKNHSWFTPLAWRCKSWQCQVLWITDQQTARSFFRIKLIRKSTSLAAWGSLPLTKTRTFQVKFWDKEAKIAFNFFWSCSKCVNKLSCPTTTNTEDIVASLAFIKALCFMTAQDKCRQLHIQKDEIILLRHSFSQYLLYRALVFLCYCLWPHETFETFWP